LKEKYKKYRVFRVAVCPSSIKDARFLKVKSMKIYRPYNSSDG
jgi:hypothetical protein